MGNLERDIGKLLADVKSLSAELSELKRTDLAELKKDVRSLLEFKWRIYGATALIAFVCSTIVEVAFALSRHGG